MSRSRILAQNVIKVSLYFKFDQRITFIQKSGMRGKIGKLFKMALKLILDVFKHQIALSGKIFDKVESISYFHKDVT